MKLKLTALAVLLAASTSMHAALVDYQAGDLVLSVYAKGGVGSTVNVSVGLGDLATAFRDGALGGSSYWTSSASDTWSFNTNLGATLTAQFGANWQSRTDLYWGISGVLNNSSVAGAVGGDPRKTIYVSHATGALHETFSAAQVGDIATGIVTFQGTFATRDADAGQTLIVTYSESDTNSYESWMAGGSTPNGTRTADWNYLNSGANLSSSLTLERYLALTTGANPSGTIGVGSTVGTFSIDGNGNLTFQTQAVPEPSTVGLFVVTALGLGFVLWKRRRSASAAV